MEKRYPARLLELKVRTIRGGKGLTAEHASGDRRAVGPLVARHGARRGVGAAGRGAKGAARRRLLYYHAQLYLIASRLCRHVPLVLCSLILWSSAYRTYLATSWPLARGTTSPTGFVRRLARGLFGRARSWRDINSTNPTPHSPDLTCDDARGRAPSHYVVVAQADRAQRVMVSVQLAPHTSSSSVQSQLGAAQAQSSHPMQYNPVAAQPSAAKPSAAQTVQQTAQRHAPALRAGLHHETVHKRATMHGACEMISVRS